MHPSMKQGQLQFDSFIPIGAIQPVQKKTGSKKLLQEERGCKFCTLNNVDGIRKIKGTIKGKAIAIIAQSPGPDENQEGIELVGPAGQWLWTELRRVGIRRKDVDVQNIVRCFPADWHEGSYSRYLKMRDPTKLEIHCCSKYNDEAIEKLQARQVLIFGKLAQLSFLKLRSTPAEKSFWSDELNAKVYLLDHPAYFVRGYGKGPRLDAFREQLKYVAKDRKLLARDGTVKQEGTTNLSDQYAILKKQDYRLVQTRGEAEAAKKIICQYGYKGRRVALDIESDNLEDPKFHSIFAIGFSPKPGLSFTFIVKDYEMVGHGQDVLEVAKEICEDPKVEKVCQYGCSDVKALKESVGIKVAGWTHDTMLSEYLRFSDLKQYGLDDIVERRLPEFSGYKTIICRDLVANNQAAPEKIRKGPPGMQLKWLQANPEHYHLSKLSLDTLRLYNGGDCDVTKRIEIKNKKYIPQALMQLYMDLTVLLQKMEKRGPWFDFEQCEKLMLIYPVLEKKLRRRLQKLAGSKKFNPGSPQQVYHVMYNVLGLEYPFEGKPNTGKSALLVLGRKHKFPKLMLEWRITDKVKGILKSYKACAEDNEGRLTTKWNSTTTRTGRLSSGGKKSKKGRKIVNLQNIKKDADVKNMLVADKKWKVAYDAIGKIVDTYPEIKQFWKLQNEADKWNKDNPDNRKSKLKMSEHMTSLFESCSTQIETWVRQHMPKLKVYLCFDYGQVEVRVYAQIANDKNLIKDCSESDIHTKVGVTLTGWDADLIANDEGIRTLTKAAHFGILFLLNKPNLLKFVLTRTPDDMVKRITKQLEKKGMTIEDMVFDGYDRYFARYDKVKLYMDDAIAFAEKHGYVKTLFGMFQTINVRDNDRSQEVEVDEEDERGAYWGAQAVNGPVQGTAHQLVECGEVNLVRKPKKYKVLGTPPAEVHDALYFAVNVLSFKKAFKRGKYLLEQESLNTVKSDFPDINWKVPIVVDAKAGIRLGDQVKVDENTTPGRLLLDWYRVCKDNCTRLDKLLEEVAAMDEKQLKLDN